MFQNAHAHPGIPSVAGKGKVPKGALRRQGRRSECANLATWNCGGVSNIDLDIATATKIAKDRIEWKKLRPSKRC